MSGTAAIEVGGTETWDLIRQVVTKGREDGLGDDQLAGAIYTVLRSHGLPDGDEVAELRADKARLDFLDACNRALNQRYGTNYGWELILSHNVTRLMLGEFHAGEPRGLDLNDACGGNAKLPSCRAAIDKRRPRS